jgi:thiosulfate reductase cytochrome b subunit
MSEKPTGRIYLFTKYERLWHWLQMAIIFTLLLTGFEAAGRFKILGYEEAAFLHNRVGLFWVIAFLVFLFWIFTTSEWKQYIPTTKNLFDVVIYYIYGIFAGHAHPFPKTKEAKHNPLQRFTYLALATILLPFQMATGLLYWSYNSWEAWGIDKYLSLKWLAAVHVAGAFAILAFVIIHVYMTTTGHTVFGYIKGMITGWEDTYDD